MAIFIGCFTRTFFLCESQILYCLAKAKDSHLRNYLEVHFSELAFEFYCKKESYVESFDSNSNSSFMVLYIFFYLMLFYGC